MEQRDYTRDYILRAAELLELSDWRINIHFADVEGALADVAMPPDQRIATIRITSGFWKLSRENKRQTIAHELMHMHMAPYDDAVYAVVGAEARRALSSISERVVDSVAWPLSRTLPEWGA